MQVWLTILRIALDRARSGVLSCILQRLIVGFLESRGTREKPHTLALQATRRDWGRQTRDSEWNPESWP